MSAYWMFCIYLFGKTHLARQNEFQQKWNKKIDIDCVFVWSPEHLGRESAYMLRSKKESREVKLQWKVSLLGVGVSILINFGGWTGELHPAKICIQ